MWRNVYWMRIQQERVIEGEEWKKAHGVSVIKLINSKVSDAVGLFF